MSKMQCGTCSKKFSILRAKKQCTECKGYYCKCCVMRKANKHLNCENCAVLTSRPLSKAQLLKIKSKDLQNYLNKRHICTRGCFEKDDLINLVLAHTNSTNDVQSPVEESDNPLNLLGNIRSFFTNSTSNLSEPSRFFFHTEQTASTHSTPGTTSRFQFQSPTFNVTTESRTQPSSGTTDDDWEIVDREQSENRQEQVIVVEDSDTDTEILNEETTNPHVIESEASTSVEKCVVHIQLNDVTDKEQIETLTVKNLKEILLRNRVDYKGCIEKADLKDKVIRLWNEYSESRKHIATLPMEDLCKICMDAPIECVMLECGHMATCTSCGKQLAECPICRQYVVRVVKTFRV